MEKPKISVIVPVYNAEKCLRRALDSICNQTYKNLEIILVDDGSKDGSGIICDEYKEKDNRIVLVHQENSGVSVTRNKALSMVTGELMGFVDADDYIVPDFFERLYQCKKKTGADIAMCNYVRFSGDVELVQVEHVEPKVWTGMEALKNIYGSYGHLFSGVLWNKLYESKLFEEFRFPEGMKNEDEYLLARVIDKANAVAFIDENIYHYYINEGSITESSSYLMSEDIYKVFEDRMVYFSAKGQEYDEIVNLTKKAYLDRIISRYQKLPNKDMRIRYREKYKEYGQSVEGIGYQIFNVSPKMYYLLVKLMGK